MLGTKILFFGALALGSALLLTGGEAKAASASPKKLPESKPRRGVPRNGPGGTVLLKDLPPECQGYYDVAFGLTGASGCADAYTFGAERDRMYQLYLDEDPFFEIDQYDAISAAFERANVQCEMANASEEAAIAAWVGCLDNLGLTPQEVWAG